VNGYRTWVLRLHDTALGRVVPFEPRQPGKVSMYVCGPTVYDVPHIGHGRNVLVYDVLRRYLEWSGFEVTHVSNVTDVDDNIIKRANEQGRAAEEVAEQYEAAWWDAVDRLGVLRPTAAPHASAYIDGMVEVVSRLLDSGFAYETPDGVYFEAARVPDYGLLAGQALESMRVGGGERVVVGEEAKRAPADFALWKRAKPGEPNWPSPWGDGRPGWHTECVVMSLDLLGDGFDLHTGGLDLKFPHHENERAQAVALGHRFARHWMHHAFVEIGGEKMSKSLKNFTSLTDLLARTNRRAYRLLVLQAHYRSPMEVTPDTVEQAQATLAGLDNFARAAAKVSPGAPDVAVMQQFTERMDDDLNTPSAMELLFTTVTRFNSSRDPALAAAVLEMARAVGLELQPATDEIDPESADLVRQRDVARAQKNWARADALREELRARGWIVEDGPDGTEIHR
jgi:cysteinyl-tRNA synthetase